MKMLKYFAVLILVNNLKKIHTVSKEISPVCSAMSTWFMNAPQVLASVKKCTILLHETIRVCCHKNVLVLLLLD